MLIYLSSLFFALMGVTVKWLSTVPAGGGLMHPDQVSFMRSVLPAVLMTPALAAEVRRQGPAFKRVGPLLLLRGLLGSTALIFYFRSISMIEFSNAALLCYTSPIFAGVFAAIFLKEPLGRRSIAAFAVAFAGVVMVLRPGMLFAGALPPHVVEGTLYGLASGVTAGGSYTAIRHLAALCSTTSIMAALSWTGTVLCAPLAAAAWVPPTGVQWVALVGVAAMATVAQWLMTEGYRRYSAAHASTMNLSIVLFATVLGLVFFHEVPGRVEIAGMMLVLAGLAMVDAKHAEEMAESEVG